MRRNLMIAVLAATVAAPSLASAGDSCGSQAHNRRVTGTVLGGVGGALIGQAISHNTAGTLLGGVGGAVIGNQVARTSCDRPHYAAHPARVSHHSTEQPYSQNAAYSAPGGCSYENRPYYDERGQLVYHPTQVCR
jgi:uncharacterized protein YcfJ